ncbi:hypothetical protein Drose_25805 [Dactylosporangium roseum]|uniref:Uncharacterized protein n=1 Tax=Dactylosporangium roseum TaxID=47989 RepID=A0ABY5YZ14_9ACTN|nr:hypothetical protein [Dactylosporangium roseum]UWZ34624.1 hypothetical protein Drose_25805 [Dactylosporangium roseum]
MSEDVIPDEQMPLSVSALKDTLHTETLETVGQAVEQLAGWLVGGRSPLGGVGGESETFENDVVQGVAKAVVAAADGWPDTAVREGNWMRQLTRVHAQAAERHALDTRFSLSALGNSAGVSADTYDAADRAGHQSFDPVAAGLDSLSAKASR